MLRKSRTIIVKHSEFVTPNMKRITFTGEDLNEFSPELNGYYIKLVIPNTSKGLLGRNKVRTYTIREFNDSTKEMIVDFAMHEPAGPATEWAKQVKIGDQISFMGPGPKKLDTSVEGWYLFMADMSAMPAAIAAIEGLPNSVNGEVFFEITNEKDIQDFQKPKELKVNWLIHTNPKQVSNQQLEALKNIDIPNAPNVFVAGELNTVKKLKTYLLSNKNVCESKNVYISSYWKIGNTDEEHKRAKMTL